MTDIKKSAIVPYSAQKMFSLVSDIDNYVKYLPWCSRSEVLSQEDNIVTGAVYIDYLKVKTHFITKNTQNPPNKIILNLVEGPFKALSGEWNFTQLGESGCKIDFVLHYKFSNIILEKLIDPIFSYISKNIMDCFIKEAHAQHKKEILELDNGQKTP